MIRLVISDNEGTTTVVPLVRDEISIGRKEGNTIRLTERNISRKHARLHKSNGDYHLEDLGSYNGVLVNGRRVVGDTTLSRGDKIQIGDYTMLVEAEEVQAAAPEVDEAEPTRVAPVPAAGPPARLVVLAGPQPGAEFPLPEQGEVRIGRAEELDITIDHRSVSREHAKLVCTPEGCRVADLGSANGVLLNGSRVEDAALEAADRIELGEVVLRFVAPGEQFTFSPSAVSPLVPPRKKRAQSGLWLAVAIVTGALVAAFFILSGDSAPAVEGAEASVKPEQSPVLAAEPEPAEPALAAPPPQPKPAAQADAAAASVAACEAAIAGGRYAEAMAHAAQALKSHPDAQAATECEQKATGLHEQEQTFVRGKAAFEAEDFEAAHAELSKLSEDSEFAQRPEVKQAAAKLGRARIAQARKQLRRAPQQALSLAQSVLELPDQPPGVVAEARRIAAQAGQTKPVAAQRTAKSKPREPRARANQKSPLEVASDCLSRGDNACVVRALNGKARTAQELGLLIETYRAMGNSAAAYKHMSVYVKRFPTARRTSAYQKMLERR